MEILNVLMPMFSGDKDEFGKEHVPPLPLSFDRVNAGQPPRSNAALFTLPYEILGRILVHISSESLPALALVNHDCLQWARSRQFCSIQLNYSYASSNLLNKLLIEAKQRLDAGDMNSPSLGHCIRRITVATSPSWACHRLGVDFMSEEFRNLPEDKQRERMVDASKVFLVGYISVIQIVLNIITMPHLELLDWEDKISLPHSFFNYVAMSSIKHLKLYRVKVKEEFFIELPEACKDQQWPLQTLHIEISPTAEKISTSPLSTSILRLCAPTLRDLNMEYMNLYGEAPLTFVDQKSGPAPRFPSLRNLTVGGGILFEDASVLDALVQDNLRTLDVETESNCVTKVFFRQRGRIPALETFVWESSHLPADHALDFLRANAQITKLALPHANPSMLLEVGLLALLSKSFSNLTSLSLVWESTSISELSLETVASLRTLEQLHLSSGNQHGWRHDWLIDHQVMRKHLSKLCLLKKLAFSRDTYMSRSWWLPVHQYYVDHTLLVEDMPENADDNDKVWEQIHSERIQEAVRRSHGQCEMAVFWADSHACCWVSKDWRKISRTIVSGTRQLLDITENYVWREYFMSFNETLPELMVSFHAADYRH